MVRVLFESFFILVIIVYKLLRNYFLKSFFVRGWGINSILLGFIVYEWFEGSLVVVER